MLCCVVLCCVVLCCVVLCCFVLSFVVFSGVVCDLLLTLISCCVVVGGVRSLILISLTENLNRGRPQFKEDETGVMSD